MGRKKDNEEYLLRWRRRQVAEMWFEGVNIDKIADKLKVDKRTIYRDQEYIENHADDLMKNYLVKTVPHIINKSIYQIDLANREVIKVLKDSGSDKKTKISAAMAVSKTARDVVEIIAGNKGVVEAALALDKSSFLSSSSSSSSLSLLSDQQNEGEGKGEEAEEEEENELLSGDSTETEETREDPNAKF
jgi:hypothetical protein